MIYFYILIFIQVVIESLPLSSSTHVKLFKKSVPFLNTTSSNTSAFDHMLHLPTVLIVALFFWSRWFFLLRNIHRCRFIVLKLIILTCIADIVTALFYYLFQIYPISLPLPYGLSITAFLLYSLRWCTPQNKYEFESTSAITQKQIHDNHSFNKTHIFDIKSAILLGCVQGLALLPGISRFASVYVATQWLGFNTHKGLEVTWMIFWPLMILASMHGMYQLAHDHALSPLITPPMLIIMAFATLCGYAAFCFAARLAYTNRFWQFSWYVALLALITFWVM